MKYSLFFEPCSDIYIYIGVFVCSVDALVSCCVDLFVIQMSVLCDDRRLMLNIQTHTRFLAQGHARR